MAELESMRQFNRNADHLDLCREEMAAEEARARLREANRRRAAEKQNQESARRRKEEEEAAEEAAAEAAAEARAQDERGQQVAMPSLVGEQPSGGAHGGGRTRVAMTRQLLAALSMQISPERTIG